MHNINYIRENPTAFDNAMKELRRRISEGDRMEISDALGSDKITQVYSRITDRIIAI